MRIEFQYPVFDPPLGGVENYILECSAALALLGHQAQVLTGPLREKSIETMEAAKQDAANAASSLSHPLVYRHEVLGVRGLLLVVRPLFELRRLRRAIDVPRPRPDHIVARYPSYAIASKDVYPTVPISYIPAEDLVKRLERELVGGDLKARFFALILRPQLQWLERKAAQASDRFLVFSNNFKRQMEARTGRTPAVVPPGCNVERFKPNLAARKEIRHTIKCPDETKVLLTVARLSPEKNIAYGLDIISHLQKDIWYLVVGTGDQLPVLQSHARELGIDDRVFFLGSTPNPQDYYAAADIYLHPATTESFGHVLLEAMACSTPVVAVAGAEGHLVASEEILPPEASILISARDAEGAAEKIQELLSRHDRMEAMRDSAREHVLSHYSWRDHAIAILDTADT